MQIINKTQFYKQGENYKQNDSTENAAVDDNININYVMLLARI